jgi:hypothetical protein
MWSAGLMLSLGNGHHAAAGHGDRERAALHLFLPVVRLALVAPS